MTRDTGDGAASLAVCTYGDRRPKILPVTAGAWEISWSAITAVLELIRPYVEQTGARDKDRDEAATHWWYPHPDARGAQP